LKDYRKFLLVFTALFALYIVAEVNKPTPVNWAVTLSKNDKNPYGSYILYNHLNNLFPAARIQSYRLPLYDQLNNYKGDNSAYFIISSAFSPSENDWEEMKNYVSEGNYVFAAATSFSKKVLDSLGFKTYSKVALISNDSTSVNFVNPRLKSKNNYGFKKQTIDEYFSEIDTSRTIVLGINDEEKPNYIKVGLGGGAFFIHADPICFSNYFMLFKNNKEYTAKALSYIPGGVTKIYWDEFYKLGSAAATTPLRFFLSNEFLLWALRLSVIALVLYILFEMKRRQRVIPVITPLRNSTLEFVKTVSNVYFNQKDNNSIANKKINHFLEFIRNRFYLSTQQLNEDFITQLSRKSGVARENIDDIFRLINDSNAGYAVNDKYLLTLNQQIDNFYKQVR
jgi:hypothetical protein